MKILFLATASLIVAVPVLAQQSPMPVDATVIAVPDAVTNAVNAPDRPAADKARDAQRNPVLTLVFTGAKPGDKIADLMPGGGYFTRLFSAVAGPSGKVYAAVPAAMLAKRPDADAAIRALAAAPGSNVIETKIDDSGIGVPESLDLAFTAQNYHDVYGHDPAAAAKLDAAVFAALKPGGIYFIIDHVAKSGDSSAPTTLHRIDPAVVKAQVLKAGFQFVGEEVFLHNLADSHDKPVFDPSIRGATDQFVYKFRKP